MGTGMGMDMEGTQQKQFTILTEQEREKAMYFHTRLAGYYRDQIFTNGDYDLRTLRVATHHSLAAKQMTELERVLLHPAVFKAMYR